MVVLVAWKREPRPQLFEGLSALSGVGRLDTEIGVRVPGSRVTLSAIGYRLSAIGYRLPPPKGAGTVRVSGLGLQVSGDGYRVFG